ncbi:MAG: hypothetical protein LBK83_05500 [Treponema sp.]|jgi:predicted peptidase|nr:hypothetical protein [Treponema sp.]
MSKQPGRSEDRSGSIPVHRDSPDFSDSAQFVLPENITAVGIIMEDGLTLAAMRILYSGEIDAGMLTPGYFQVPGRKVIHTYVNNSGKRHHSAQKGVYAFVELLINEAPDSNEFKEIPGAFKFDPRGESWTIELPLIATLRQIKTGYSVDGRKIPPYSRANDDQYIEVIDEFIRDEYTDSETHITIKYNLFVPPSYMKKQEGLADLPLILFLHGAGESGFDNRSQVSSYRQVQEYLKPAIQAENPSFVFMPQCPLTEERSRGVFEEYGWYTYITGSNGQTCYTHPSKSLKAVISALLHNIIPNYNIDSQRIYAAGHSMGAGGVLAALIERPDIFAAAVSFSSAGMFADEMLKRIIDKPVFFTVAGDEGYDIININMPIMMDQLERLGVKLCRFTGANAWNGILRGKDAENDAHSCIAAAEEQKANMIYVEYMKGTIVDIPHLSHRASFENAAIRRWLFQHRLHQPALKMPPLKETLLQTGTGSNVPAPKIAPLHVGVWGMPAGATAGARTVEDISWHYLASPDFCDREKFIVPCCIYTIGVTTESGIAIKALRIKYMGNIGIGVLKPENFVVPCCGIARVYVNQTGEYGEEKENGPYVFLEFLQRDPVLYGEISRSCTLLIAVRQVDTQFNFDGKIIPPFNKISSGQISVSST